MFKAFLATIASLLKGKQFTGVLPDPRPQEKKQQDFAHEERVVEAPVGPFENKQILVSPYPYENQWYTSSCCPHGVGLALGIERKADVGQYERLSWVFNYRQRSNYPNEGCYLQNVFDNYRHTGAPLFYSLPTPKTEAEANGAVLTSAMYNEAAIFKGLTYYTVTKNYNDIATLAGIAQQGHGVAILIYADLDEWALDYPVINKPSLTSGYAEVVHCICILPNSGFIKDGKRHVTVQDSAHFGGKVLRHLSEEFVKSRVYAAAYWDKVVPLGSGPKPKYVFNKDLRYGDTGPDVKAMQQLFISEGLLANENATGNFFGLTLAALHAFQSKYADEILKPNGLTQPTDLFGPATRLKANALCK